MCCTYGQESWQNTKNKTFAIKKLSAGILVSRLVGYLRISRRRRGDYKPIFTEPKAKLIYRLVITESEATNCFSINFQVFANNNRLNFTKIHFKFITV